MASYTLLDQADEGAYLGKLFLPFLSLKTLLVLTAYNFNV